MREFKTNSFEETAMLGFTLGKLLEGGDLVCLVGDLGTGKTAFTGGIARALGINEYITSPTFTIVNEYMGIVPLYHFDAYRIADSGEMFEIGFEEYLVGRGIVVIEWADMIADILPDEYILVKLEKDMSKGTDFRTIKIKFVGERYKLLEDMV